MNYCAVPVCFFPPYSIILILWLNKTGAERLRKVVQKAWNYSNINFNQYSLDTHGVKSVFVMNYCAARVCFISLYNIILVLW